MIMLICIKQHLSNEAEFMEKLTNTEAELKKTLLIKKTCILSGTLIDGIPVFLFPWY